MPKKCMVYPQSHELFLLLIPSFLVVIPFFTGKTLPVKKINEE